MLYFKVQLNPPVLLTIKEILVKPVRIYRVDFTFCSSSKQLTGLYEAMTSIKALHGGHRRSYFTLKLITNIKRTKKVGFILHVR